MLDLTYARDLVMTGVIFGAIAFVWAGWAHERPPKGALWRIVLVLLQVAGLALMAFGIPAAVQYWNTPTALDPSSPALTWYIVVFWLEVIAIVGFSIYFVRGGRTGSSPRSFSPWSAYTSCRSRSSSDSRSSWWWRCSHGGRSRRGIPPAAHRRTELLVRHPRGTDLPAPGNHLPPRRDRCAERLTRAEDAASK